ncbi:hypothetical protein A1O7_01315 [Cladophialophora yegresii CBS 114405]|uniref:Anaphase-promoting complex subunit 11 RING-H2 finger domain-containing protein n=1 Tax=Cladophialophora yegresii CBS 114405 TaxID=1182544 RepID=W9WK36_9EURO|nr:uncharacterized protein A1O7_01315 [Cladophialophora yegresii CBS 114405]EXJ64976.1 hypothetical protein A1O7_01315 [Cladophialophora yegresii CBS 114405]
MSQQPRQVPTHSSSPSKSSSRRTTSGGGTSTSTRPTSQAPQQQQPSNTRSLLSSPHFEDDPIVASHQQYSKRPSLTLNDPEYSEHAVAESEHCSHGLGSAHPQTTAESIPSFQPFFTLIEDSVTNEHYHPTVHYIFADDDTDMITEAALRSLEVLDPSQRAGTGPHGQSQTQGHDAHQNHEESSNASRLPAPVAGMREHYIVLDVHPQTSGTQLEDNSGTTTATSAFTYEVSSAHSLSAEWQVLRTSISTAPTIGDNPSAEDEGLMLRIEGRGNTPGNIVQKGKEADGEKEKERETMEEMIERFQRRLEDVRMVIEAGGGTSGLNIGDGAGMEDLMPQSSH